MSPQKSDRRLTLRRLEWCHEQFLKVAAADPQTEHALFRFVDPNEGDLFSKDKSPATHDEDDEPDEEFFHHCASKAFKFTTTVGICNKWEFSLTLFPHGLEYYSASGRYPYFWDVRGEDATRKARRDLWVFEKEIAKIARAIEPTLRPITDEYQPGYDAWMLRVHHLLETPEHAMNPQDTSWFRRLPSSVALSSALAIETLYRQFRGEEGDLDETIVSPRAREEMLPPERVEPDLSDKERDLLRVIVKTPGLTAKAIAMELFSSADTVPIRHDLATFRKFKIVTSGGEGYVATPWGERVLAANEK